MSPVPDLLSIGPNINTEWSEYPSAVQVSQGLNENVRMRIQYLSNDNLNFSQDAISALKAQYELEDGELEAVVRNLWEAEPGLGFSDNILSPEEAYITLPRSDTASYFT